MGRTGFRRKYGGIYRPQSLTIGDERSPMHRFLSETKRAGCAAPLYHQQWATLFKAEKLGYITGYSGTLTAKGRALLNSMERAVRGGKG